MREWTDFPTIVLHTASSVFQVHHHTLAGAKGPAVTTQPKARLLVVPTV